MEEKILKKIEDESSGERRKSVRDLFLRVVNKNYFDPKDVVALTKKKYDLEKMMHFFVTVAAEKLQNRRRPFYWYYNVIRLENIFSKWSSLASFSINSNEKKKFLLN